jgi:hypothetical protein
MYKSICQSLNIELVVNCRGKKMHSVSTIRNGVLFVHNDN